MTFERVDRRRVRANALRLAAALMVGTAASAIAIAPAHAQQSNASLRGTITTDSGVTVTSVTAVEIATNIRRNATLSAGGVYNLPSLRAGEYRLEIVLSSGSRTTDAFTLSVAQSAQLNFDSPKAESMPRPRRAETPPKPTSVPKAATSSSPALVSVKWKAAKSASPSRSA